MEKIEEFFSQFNTIKYKKKEIVIRAEDEPKGVYFVKSGYVKMNSVFEDGKELTLNIFKPGSYFPMMLVIGEICNSYYFQAMTPLELIRAPKEVVLDFMKTDNEVLFEFTRRILIGMCGLLTNMEFLLSGSAYRRVISAILISARRFGEKDGKGKVMITLPLTHQDIADLAGITRETTSMEVEKLMKEGFVSYNKRLLVVNDPEKLEERAFVYKELL